MRGSYVGADKVDLKHLIVREVDDPINEIAIIAFLRKSMSQKDWDSFVEVFKIPDLFFEMPAGLDENDASLINSAQQLVGSTEAVQAVLGGVGENAKIADSKLKDMAKSAGKTEEAFKKVDQFREFAKSCRREVGYHRHKRYG